MKNLYLLILFSISLLMAEPIVNDETGWAYEQSTSIGFYIFEEVQIDGQPAETSDVLGAFFNDVCVGWTYMNGVDWETTLPLMGAIEEFPSYLNEGDIPTLKMYDATYGTILEASTVEDLPGWQSEFAIPVSGVSFANNPIINTATGWYYSQSASQSFYIFEDILAFNQPLNETHVIGSFKGDLCTGWVVANPNGNTTVPVMGVDTLNFDYFNTGEIPDFKLFDIENGIVYILPSSEIPAFNDGVNYIEGTSIANDIIGCMDDTACNYNYMANIDDGSCLYVTDDFGGCCDELFVYFEDADGDTLGDPDSSIEACEIQDGYVVNSDDEYPDCFSNIVDCAGICDGSAEIETYWYDADGDGLGAGDPSDFCNALVDDGWVTNNDDEYPDCTSNLVDCAGTCDGDAYVDNCGTCDNNSENDCVQDCTGEWGGTAEIITVCYDADLDEYGDPLTEQEVCDAYLETGWLEDCSDENDSIYCESNFIDNCDVCDGDDSSCTGCMDENALNFDYEATIACDDCCEYVEQNIDLTSGWNMISLNVNPIDETLFDILTPIHDQMLLVIDETGSAIFPNPDQTWADNIGQWFNSEGYLLKIDGDQVLNIQSQGIIDLPLDIQLSEGWNIISFPIQNTDGQNIEDVFSSLVDNGSLFKVINEGGQVYVPETGLNSIGGMFPGEGYYVNVYDDEVLSINESNVVFTHEFQNNQNRTEHFEPVWSGNPFSPMPIQVWSANWDGEPLESGDEIGIFDGDICVGAYTVPDGGFTSAEIVTSKDDGSGNGFTEGNSVKVRVWRESAQVDIDADITTFTNEGGQNISAVFEALLIPNMEIEVVAPSTPSSFSATGGSNQVSLNWNSSFDGNYNTYLDGQSTPAISYKILRDDIEIAVVEPSNYLDLGLDNNTVYTYQIQAVSVVGESGFNIQNALTKPGTPIISLTAGENQIHIDWVDPVQTGDGDEINYLLDRIWVVGDESYNVELTSENYIEQFFTDIGLLNSTEFGYSVTAHNSSGYSDPSELVFEFTLPPNPGVPEVVENVELEPIQTIDPPDNNIIVSWGSTIGSDFYRVYESALLIAEDITDLSFSQTGLENSTLYQYNVVAVNENGESAPSVLENVETFGEIAPPIPPSFALTANQNSVDLSWEASEGFGYPVGGDAVSYDIYRITTDDFDANNIDEGDIIGSSSGLSFTDSNLEDVTQYCYAVAGVNSEGLSGELTDIYCVITLISEAPSTPTNILATGGNQQVSISWDASSGSTPLTYQVYRFDNVYIGETSSTSFLDVGLAKDTEYYYSISAFNELGVSEPGISNITTTTSQASILAPFAPVNITAELTVNSRTDNVIDGQVDVAWEPEQFEADPFELAYQGNPYQPMTIIITEAFFEDVPLSDGDVIGVYDGELCVGKGTYPLPNGQISASKDDGSGNGFTEGNNVFFKVWLSSTQNVVTAIESPTVSFSGLGLEYVSIASVSDTYNVYRNGVILEENVSSLQFIDTSLETEMEYSYLVTAVNILGSIYESNPSEFATINTFEELGNPPVIADIENQIIDEDTELEIELNATDLDDDSIIFFSRPVDDDAPVSCFVDGTELTVIPHANYHGEFEIQVIAYDDTVYFESNTLTDTTTFVLDVLSINDAPIVLNPVDDVFVYQNSPSMEFDISDVFHDVDEFIMNDDALTISVSIEDVSLATPSIFNDTLLIDFNQGIFGETNIILSAEDIFNSEASDTIRLIIDSELSNLDELPEMFGLSNAYPNPFNPTTYFTVQIPIHADVEVNVLNIHGKIVDEIYSGELSSGEYKMIWVADYYPSGVYFLQLLTQKVQTTRKIILMK